MRRGVLLALCLGLGLTACGGGSTGDTELHVFAAASLQEALTEIGTRYEADHPGVALVFHFDSSGALKAQIQEGAECDVFLSAGKRQMDQLDAAAAPAVDAAAPEEEPAGEAPDLIDSNTRRDLLENQVTLAVPQGNPGGITSFGRLAERLEQGNVLAAVGNGDVPVGQYTQRLFRYYGLDEEALAASGVLTYGSNVKEVTAQILEGTVDCGIVYATDARAAGLMVVDTATEEQCGRVVYPAAVSRNSGRPQEARAFLDALSSGEAAEVFAGMGFTVLAEDS
ncbi:MAG: extracellular solute-binding protein [Oscillibacter sp.]|jgi:molybdate transport system substrate-binding protein|nr:extracellular solute-binding protein [Oscillibacter sp.]